MEQVPIERIETREQAEDLAITWQAWMSEQSLSQGEFAEWASYFEEIAERFDLVDEFRENAII